MSNVASGAKPSPATVTALPAATDPCDVWTVGCSAAGAVVVDVVGGFVGDVVVDGLVVAGAVVVVEAVGSVTTKSSGAVK